MGKGSTGHRDVPTKGHSSSRLSLSKILLEVHKVVPQPPQLPKQPQQCSSSLSCPKSHSSQPSHGAGGHQRGSRTGRKPLGSTKPCAFSILSLGQICSMPERKLRSPEWICSRVLESKSRFLRCRERNQIHQGVPGWFWLYRFATEANLTNSLQGVEGGEGGAAGSPSTVLMLSLGQRWVPS